MRKYLHDLFPPEIPEYSFSCIKRRKILVLGIGGGNDATTACAVASMLRDIHPDAKILYANCVSPKDAYFGFGKLSPHLHRRAKSADNPEDNHTLHQMRRLPQDSSGSPFVITMPPGKEAAAMHGALNILKPDAVFAMDGGGDSLTGGENPDKIGFDVRSIHALRSCGTDFNYLVAGPGCDGESTAAQIKSAVSREYDAGALSGWFDLTPALDKMRGYAPAPRKDGSPNTPNVMLEAKSLLDKEPQLEMRFYNVKRHRHPDIPLRWLTIGIVFNGKQFIGPGNTPRKN